VIIEWLAAPSVLLRWAFRRVTSAFILLALLSGVVYFVLRVAVHASSLRTVGIVLAFVLAVLVGPMDLAVFVLGTFSGIFSLAWTSMRESGILVSLLLPGNRRRMNNVLDGRYILLLRRFSKIGDSGLEKAMKGKGWYTRNPLTGGLRSIGGFSHDWGQLPKLLSVITFPIVTLLNSQYVPSLPRRRLVLIPAHADRWKEAVEASVMGAAGVLFIIKELTPNIEFELGLMAMLNPERVLIILDVALEDWAPELDLPSAQKMRRETLQAHMAKWLTREWKSKCPPQLQSRTLPLGAEIEPIVRQWIHECEKDR
jgi:hypothetical protein